MFSKDVADGRADPLHPAAPQPHPHHLPHYLPGAFARESYTQSLGLSPCMSGVVLKATWFLLGYIGGFRGNQKEETSCAQSLAQFWLVVRPDLWQCPGPFRPFVFSGAL